MPVPVLCINLRPARRRWANIQAQMARVLPDVPLRRVEAVDWRQLPEDPPLTLFSRYLLRFPGVQGRQRLSHRQLDTPSSVAILLSHVRCWEWVATHADCALILEDDACFDEPFLAAWRGPVAALAAAPADWDCLVLGYFAAPHGGDPAAPVVAGATLRRPVPFFGAHAYCVTRRGCETLLRHAFPMDHQADGLFLTLSDLGLLRLYLLPRSVVSQCINEEDRQGSWHTHSTASLVYLDGARTWWSVWCPAAVLLVLVAVGAALWHRRRAVR